jgi:hypothetical protein
MNKYPPSKKCISPRFPPVSGMDLAFPLLYNYFCIFFSDEAESFWIIPVLYKIFNFNLLKYNIKILITRGMDILFF